VGKAKRKRALERLRFVRDDNIKMDTEETGSGDRAALIVFRVWEERRLL
jgi:hypothetical protein